MAEFAPPDAEIAFGAFTIRRAVASDASAYCTADAEMVGATYAYTMPPAFAARLLEEVPTETSEHARVFSESLAAERRGEEPQRRTWIALGKDGIVGIVVSAAAAPAWEAELDAPALPGIRYQLNHLYTMPSAHGTGLGQVLLDLALPDRLPAYLWLVNGNARAQRFYARNGFVTEDRAYETPASWYHNPLYRMVRGTGFTAGR
jgi:GNAT superfamily N-acetyltransferase